MRVTTNRADIDVTKEQLQTAIDSSIIVGAARGLEEVGFVTKEMPLGGLSTWHDRRK